MASVAQEGGRSAEQAVGKRGRGRPKGSGRGAGAEKGAGAREAAKEGRGAAEKGNGTGAGAGAGAGSAPQADLRVETPETGPREVPFESLHQGKRGPGRPPKPKAPTLQTGLELLARGIFA